MPLLSNSLLIDTSKWKEEGQIIAASHILVDQTTNNYASTAELFYMVAERGFFSYTEKWSWSRELELEQTVFRLQTDP